MEILRIFPDEIKDMLVSQISNIDGINEIRLRAEREIIVKVSNDEIVLKKDNIPFILNTKTIRIILEYISNYSIYAYEDEIKQGFITIEGGHRVGICGKVVLDDLSKKIQTINYISSLNIRVAREKKGIADDVIPYIINGNSIHHVLIISPPGYGKTTLLRDIIRQLSDGNKYINGMNVGVVDEREEIAATHLGRNYNDVGKRTDVLSACPKTLGMLMLLRSMSPKVIAVDEIGSKEDIEAIRYVINSGCKIIATVHGNSLEEIKEKPYLNSLINEYVFTKIIIIEKGYNVSIIENIQNSKNVG